MAWYRCGGGGLPAGLQSDMDAVLNKKFSTSTTYPPADWAPTVNLMGPLPEKTASGSIASFSDGADGVPVKSCVVSFTPSGGGGTPSAPVAIQGVSGLSVTRADKPITSNMFEGGSFSENNPVGTSYDDMKITNTSRNRVKELISVSSSGFTISCKTGYNLFLCYFDNNGLYKGTYEGWLNSKLVTQTDGYYVAVAFRRSDNGTIQASDFENAQILIKTSSDVVVTDTFGQTIYGGTRDIATDKASVTYAYASHTLSEFTAGTTSGGYTLYRLVNFFGSGVSIQNTNKQICNVAPYAYDTSASLHFYVGGGGRMELYLPDDWSDMTLVIEAVAELATPTELTGLTPHEINTLLGDNNIYADTGNTSVEYRADIDLLLGGQ